MPILTSTLSDKTRITAIKAQVSSDLAGEAVILSLKSGVYYGLNAVGASIWMLIQEPKTIAEIRDALLQEYDVEADVCDRDLQGLLQDLIASELVEVEDAATA